MQAIQFKKSDGYGKKGEKFIMHVIFYLYSMKFWIKIFMRVIAFIHVHKVKLAF